ncbi:hypothetical protein G0U57_006898 [Chelydra serpentina]|uniref:Uncharacterized protein n=1 Tax=Chelydra serpentina TaxID=8475 RepID=A0A8T1SID4_CHESE|nr:hypothetical protein G0U57_006898 [Chelydra serpentina]
MLGVSRDLFTLSVFYQDLVLATRIMGEDLLAEPLLHNPHLDVQVRESPLMHQSLLLAVTTRIGDFMDYNQGDRMNPMALGQRMELYILHVPHLLLQEMRTLIKVHLPLAVFLEWVLREGAPCLTLTPGPLCFPSHPLKNHLSLP